MPQSILLVHQYHPLAFMQTYIQFQYFGYTDICMAWCFEEHFLESFEENDHNHEQVGGLLESQIHWNYCPNPFRELEKQMILMFEYLVSIIVKLCVVVISSKSFPCLLQAISSHLVNMPLKMIIHILEHAFILPTQSPKYVSLRSLSFFLKMPQ